MLYLSLILNILSTIDTTLWTKHHLTYSVENYTHYAEVLNTAIRAWNFTSIEIDRVVKGKGDIKIYFSTFPSDSNVMGRAHLPPGGIILINDEINDVSLLENVVQHEFGHALGLKHNPDDQASIMYPHFLQGVTITGKDRKDLRELYRCRFDSVTLLNHQTYLMFKGTRYERLDLNTDATTRGTVWHPSIVKVDVMYRNGTYFIISDATYYEFKFNMKFLRKGPVDYLFPRRHDKVDAVLTLVNGTIVAFTQSGQVWKDGRRIRRPYPFPNEKIQGAYSTLEENIVLTVKDYKWVYDHNFKFAFRIKMCNDVHLKKVHCCNEHSNM